MVKTVMPLSSVYNDDILGICGQTILLCLVAYHVLQGILASLAHWHGTPVAPPLSHCDNRKFPPPTTCTYECAFVAWKPLVVKP